MKRLTAIILILALISTICPGQRRSRNTMQTIIQLTSPRTQGPISFEEALAKQKNVFLFTGQSLDRSAIGQLAWAGMGNRYQQTDTSTLIIEETVSPIQLHIVSDEGVFVYQPTENSMLQTVALDVRGVIASAALVPDAVGTAGCVFVISAPSQRLASRRTAASSSRSAMLLEAGHIAQNIQLQAICLDQNLGSTVISEFDSADISQACNIARGSEILYMICVGYPLSQSTSQESNSEDTLKKAAIIVPGGNFQEEEFFTTLNTLDAASVQITVASNTTGVVRGVNGNPYDVRILANQINVDDFDGVVIIGGIGAASFINDSVVLNIIQQAFQKRKIIGATSVGTAVLASAGILNGVKVTGPLEESTNIERAGAIFTNLPVEQHMRVITCQGTSAARPFAIALADAITGK